MLYRRKTSHFICTATDPVVMTTKGQLRGYRSDGVNVFRGIDYAKAKRFQMPEAIEAWEGVKDALMYGAGCPFMTYSIKGSTDYDKLMVPSRMWALSEDCQNLNVWTQHLDPNAKRPAMVWFHGGGFAGGSATNLYSYDGYEMAEKYDVVIVTVNHRLNMLGFLDLSAFGGVYEHSGNVGMADCVMALRWVKENIAAFGGDPNNVTIYGQSGGGGKVCTLMQMPSADGLYHRAIVQSGVMGKGGPDSSRSRELGCRVAEILGLTQESITQLSEMEYEPVRDAVVQALQEFGSSSMSWAPVADGSYYVGSPMDVGFRPETKHIPMIVGSCLAEFARNIPIGAVSDFTDEQRMTMLQDFFGEDAEAAKTAFCEAYPGIDWRYAIAVDGHFRPATLAFMDRRCQEADAPVYNYVFTFESPLMGGQLTGHNGDLHFMFHNASYMDAMCKPGITERLEDNMAGAWAQFAAAGNPNHSSLVTWEAYTPEGGACLLLGDTTELRHNHDKALLALLAKHLVQMPRP